MRSTGCAGRRQIGGLPELIRRSQANLAAVAGWVERTPWVEFLAADPAIRSSTSICLKIVDEWFTGLAPKSRPRCPRRSSRCWRPRGRLTTSASYRDAPPGLRLWGGATVLPADLEAVFPWLDWAYAEVSRG